MALGESAASVRRNVAGKTLVLALLGIAVGTAISLAGTNLISSLLYGIEPSDPLTFLTMIGVLLARHCGVRTRAGHPGFPYGLGRSATLGDLMARLGSSAPRPPTVRSSAPPGRSPHKHGLM